MKQLLPAAALLLLALAPPLANGQAYPSRPIRIVVPFPPGAGLDLTVRLLQPGLSAGLGQPLVIDNRPGATGVLGAEFVARSAPDGYTIAYTVASDLALKPHVTRDFKLDVLKDFTPIAPVFESVNCIAVATSLGTGTLADLFDMAKRNPGKLNFGSSGMNSSHHLIGEMLKQQGIDMVHVPFSGLNPAVTALVGGQIQVNITNIASVTQYVRDGRVKVLAVTRAQRYPEAQDIPAVNEVLPGFSFPVGTFGFLGPGGLPPSIVARFNAEVGKAVTAPDVRAKARELSMADVHTPAPQFVVTLARAVTEYGNVVRAARLQPQ